MGAKDERSDALTGFYESFVDEELLRLPDSVETGYAIVRHQVCDCRELVTGSELAGCDALLEVEGDVAVTCHIASLSSVC